MIDLVERIVACHLALKAASIPHAFGGALALAWCTAQARGTIDIDINLLVQGDQIEATLAALPPQITWSAEDVSRLQRDLQHRLWWDATPIDLFYNSTRYHEHLIDRIRYETFAGHQVPFLSCRDLAFFKVVFDRTKDWADLEAMQSAGTLDVTFVSAAVIEMLGVDDPRLARLQALRNAASS